MDSVSGPEFVHLMKRKVLTEAAKKLVVDYVLLCLIEASTFFPNRPVPENRGLGDRVDATFPDCEVSKMIGKLTGVLNSNVGGAFADEETTSHHDEAALFRIDFLGHSLKTPGH